MFFSGLAARRTQPTQLTDASCVTVVPEESQTRTESMSRCADEPEHSGSIEVARRSSYGPATPMEIDSDSRDREASRMSIFSSLLVTDRLISEMRVCAVRSIRSAVTVESPKTGVVSRLQEYDVFKGQVFAGPGVKTVG